MERCASKYRPRQPGRASAEGWFGEPARVTDVVIDPPKGSPKKFVEDMEVTFPLGPNGQLLLDAAGNPAFMSPPVMGQFKFRTAIRKAAGQVADDPPRLAEMRQMRFKLNGKEYTFTPDKVRAVHRRRTAIRSWASISSPTPTCSLTRENPGRAMHPASTSCSAASARG